MRTAVITVTSSSIDLSVLAGYCRNLGQFSLADSSLSVERNDEIMIIVEVRDYEANGIFEDWPAEMIPNKPFTVFAIDFRGVDLLVGLIERLNGSFKIYVDNDNGIVVEGGSMPTDFFQPSD